MNRLKFRPWAIIAHCLSLKRWCAIALGALVLVALPAMALPTAINAVNDGALSGANVEWLVDEQLKLNDPAAALSAEQLPWKNVNREDINLGFVNAPVWFRLRISNLENTPQQRYLAIEYPLLGDVSAWFYHDGQLLGSERMGNALPFSSRPVDHRGFIMPLELPAGATVSVVLRVQSTSSMQLPLALWRSDTLLARTERSTIVLGFYYGTLVVMLVYNFFVFLSGRERKYLHYIFFVISVGSFFLCINGLGSQYLWPDIPGIGKQLMPISMAAVLLFSSSFTRDYLGLRNDRKILDNAYLGVCWLAVLIALSSLLLPYSLLVKPTLFFLAGTAGTILATGIVRSLDRYPGAVLFTLAWAIMLLGALAMVFNKLGWVPRTPLTEHTAQLGSMLELMLLSLGLVSQLSKERKAKYHAQQEALDFERQANLSRMQALEAQQQATIDLEKRVEERTHELQALNEKLQALSTTDSLTGLKNRRYFNERFLDEFTRSKRLGTTIAVLLIDIDHFKNVNDTYGHLAGDDLLRAIANIIGAEIKRESDVIARYGGEEFAAVLVNISLDTAKHIAEKIRQKIDQELYRSGEQSIRCTASFGVAALQPARDDDGDDLLKQADTALYHSKSAGRNRVSVFALAS